MSSKQANNGAKEEFTEYCPKYIQYSDKGLSKQYFSIMNILIKPEYLCEQKMHQFSGVDPVFVEFRLSTHRV